MGLFERKNCARCGKELGLIFGKTKLADGTICKDCNALLSPLLSNKAKLTLANIEEHLKYREENKRALYNFKASTVLDSKDKVFFDDNQKKFVVYGSNDYLAKNIDIFSLDQVSSCELKIAEEQKELFTEDKDGNEVSYEPAKYETSYVYTVELTLSHPWVSNLTIEVSDGEVKKEDTVELLRVDNLANQIIAKLTNKDFSAKTSLVSEDDEQHWTCSCGQVNDISAKFCINCGSGKPSGAKYCPECGSKLADGTKFCPNCGKAIS